MSFVCVCVCLHKVIAVSVELSINYLRQTPAWFYPSNMGHQSPWAVRASKTFFVTIRFPVASHAVIHKGKGSDKGGPWFLFITYPGTMIPTTMQWCNDPTHLESKFYPFFIKRCNLSPLGTLCYYPGNTKQIKPLDLSQKLFRSLSLVSHIPIVSFSKRKDKRDRWLVAWHLHYN